MSARDEMLERIRTALARPTGQTAGSALELPALDSVMPPLPPEELIPKFEEEFCKVDGTVHRVATVGELEEVLRKVLDSAQGTGVVLSRNPLLAQLGLAERLHAWGKTVAAWPAKPLPALADAPGGFREAAFSAGVGITGVDFVMAESGTLVLTSVTEGAQLASLAPPVHVALYRRDQVVASMEEVLAGLAVARGEGLPSSGRSVVFVTGTSRTADIEQILVRGVHGPRHAHAILVEESCLGLPAAASKNT